MAWWDFDPEQGNCRSRHGDKDVDISFESIEKDLLTSFSLFYDCSDYKTDVEEFEYFGTEVGEQLYAEFRGWVE